jgi:acetolactate synthase-1/2/3 large subunit
MLTLDRPDLDWGALSRGMGVPASRADTCASFVRAWRHAMAARGPVLIEAVL